MHAEHRNYLCQKKGNGQRQVFFNLCFSFIRCAARNRTDNRGWAELRVHHFNLRSGYCDFPSEHWAKIRTNNVIERMNREIRRRTRVVGAFPDGNSALMLVCARLRHVAGIQWGSKKYMKHLDALEDELQAG